MDYTIQSDYRKGYEMKTLFLGQSYSYECDDILDDRCLKRFFYVNDYANGCHRVAICDHYIRLKVNNCKIQGYDTFRKYINVVEEMYFEYLEDTFLYEKIKRGYSYPNSRSRVPSNPDVNIELFEKPWITGWISLIDAIKLLPDIKHFEHRYCYTLASEISKYCTPMLELIKFKKAHNDIRWIVNTLKKDSHYLTRGAKYDDKGRLNELAMKLIDIMIKYKLD